MLRTFKTISVGRSITTGLFSKSAIRVESAVLGCALVAVGSSLWFYSTDSIQLADSKSATSIQGALNRQCNNIASCVCNYPQIPPAGGYPPNPWICGDSCSAQPGMNAVMCSGGNANQKTCEVVWTIRFCTPAGGPGSGWCGTLRRGFCNGVGGFTSTGSRGTCDGSGC